LLDDVTIMIVSQTKWRRAIKTITPENPSTTIAATPVDFRWERMNLQQKD